MHYPALADEDSMMVVSKARSYQVCAQRKLPIEPG